MRLARGGSRGAPLGSRPLAPIEAVASFVSLYHRRRFTYALDYQKYWIFLLFCSGDRLVLNEDFCKVMSGEDNGRRRSARVD